MKKWNNPEVVELNICHTANVAQTCTGTYGNGFSCNASGNGGGQCNNCRGNNPTGKKDYRQVESEEEYDDIDGVS